MDGQVVDTGRLDPAAPGAGLDAYNPQYARRSPGFLRPWNDADLITSADIHVATTLTRLGGDDDEQVALGTAFAVRALRMGHVCAEVAQLASTVTSEVADVTHLPWPAPGPWLRRLAASPLVALGDGAAEARPLRLVGERLYLDRYWRQERLVAAELIERRGATVDDVDAELLEEGVARLFPGAPPDDPQRSAAANAVRLRFSVIAGGPGTGKTTTIARLLALLVEQARGGPLRIALAAPTGRAAARLEEAAHAEAQRLVAEGTVDPDTGQRMLGLSAGTLHRLLGWRPDSHSRFRYDADNRLPYDTVIVDETSMVSLSLMAKLLAALRAGCRLILVGDPQQLASVEAGAVLGDIVGPGAGAGITVLRRVHRFGGEIAALADAVSGGDADAALQLLGAGGAALAWIPCPDGEDPSPTALEPVRAATVRAAEAVRAAAVAGDGAGALRLLGALRVLCAHRQGPFGAESWTDRMAGWLRAALPGYGAVAGYGAGDPWYPGRPVMVTRNDYELQLFNGDTGVAVAGADGSLRVAFERRGNVWEVSPARLDAVETLHASTVHKAQGSQFDAVTVVLPDAGSPILTREMLYTAVTRARRKVTVVGSDAALAAAIARPIARASGLADRLWT